MCVVRRVLADALKDRVPSKRRELVALRRDVLFAVLQSSQGVGPCSVFCNALLGLVRLD